MLPACSSARHDAGSSQRRPPASISTAIRLIESDSTSDSNAAAFGPGPRLRPAAPSRGYGHRSNPLLLHLRPVLRPRTPAPQATTGVKNNVTARPIPLPANAGPRSRSSESASDSQWPAPRADVCAAAAIRQSACDSVVPRAANRRRHSPALRPSGLPMGTTRKPSKRSSTASISPGRNPRKISSTLTGDVPSTSRVRPANRHARRPADHAGNR